MNKSRHDFAVPGAGEDADRNGAIAIIGASCRLPGAPDLDAFWELLIEGRDAVTEIPDDRWNKAQLLHPEKGHRGKAYTFAAGTLGDVSGFDPAFFGISPREATQMDPQQRLLLELAYEAIEDAGLDMAALAGRNVGVFVGGSSWDYLNLNVADVSTTDPYSMIGVTLSILANRISYVFDLHGPSFTVDTACSSSLVALHQACEAIRSGQVEAAMVGGVSLLLAPQSYVGFCAASMLSPKGRCHAFGADADGYVRSEGGGIVILKPLAEALAAGDPIRAVIRATGVNSDGRTTGLSLPNRDAQAALLSQVYGRFGIDPEQLSYLEAHGTGTLVGDPIEASALGTVLGQKRTRPLPIGSVKTNIGHLEAGSGMAGLLKAMLVAERGTIPPSLHSETPNPAIALDDLNLRLAHAAEALPEGEQRTVGVNSFGFGGTNAHAVLGSLASVATAEEPASEALPPLLLSARSDAALMALARQWRDRIAQTGTDRAALAALLRGAAVHRSQHGRRLVALGTNAAEYGEALTAHIEERGHSRLIANSAVSGKVAFVFSGNGSQWAGMAADALAGSAAFRAGLETVDKALAPWLGWSAIEVLAESDAERLRKTDIAQPLLFAVQVALVLALRDHGVEAEATMGHSVGEVAAAWASGALDLDAAARVIAARSRAQQSRHGEGEMAVMGFSAKEAAEALAEAGLDDIGIEIAAHNSSSAITVAGPAAAIERLEQESKERGWRFTRLDLDYAFHSAAMDPIETDIREGLSDLATNRSDIPFVSTVAGEIVEGRGLGAHYWWRNVRAPVLFADAARAMVADGVRIFIEVGPHPVVQAYLNDALRMSDKEGRVVPTLSRRPIKNDPIAAIAARVHAAGGDIRRSAVFETAPTGANALRSLPRYPWQRERFWVARTTESTDPATVPFDHPLLGQRVGPQPLEWVRHLGIEQMPWLADHAVGGAAVMPAAAMLDMALAAARQRRPDAVALELLEVEIGRALVLEPHVMREMRLRVGAATGDFEFASRPRLTDDPWTTHMSGRMVESDSVAASGTAPAGSATITARLSSATLYALASRLGLEYGPAFQVVDGIDIAGEDRASVRFGSAMDLGSGFLLAPNLLDGALQGLLALAADRLGEDMGVLPWRFGRVRLLAPNGAVPVAARLAVTRVGPRSVRADVALVDAAGATVAELADCWFVRVAMGRSARGEEQYFHPALVASALPGSRAATSDLMTADVIGPQRDTVVEEGRLLADAFASAVAAETLRGLMPTGPARLLPQELFRTGRISPMSRPQFDQLLRWLAADGLADQASDGSWSLTTQDIPSSDAILRTLLYDAPLAVADVALLALAGDTLPALLRDGPAAAPILPPALWDQFLGQSPSGEAAIEALVSSAMRAAAGRTQGQPFRILEVGARRGLLSRELLRRLADDNIRLVAATSPDDLPALTDALAADPRARAIAWTPGEAMVAASFDLVIGLHALSLSDDGGANVAGLIKPLAAGGMVLLAEPGVNRVWQLLRPFLAPPSEAGRWSALLSRAGLDGLQTRPVSGGLWPIDLIAGRFVVMQGNSAASRASVQLLSADGDALADALAGVLGNGATRGGLDQIGTGHAGSVVVVLGEPSTPPLADRLAMIALLSGLPTDLHHDITLVVTGSAEGDPAAAALMGARRVLANEAAHVRLRLIKIDPALKTAEAAHHVAQELASPDDEDEICWTGGGRIVSRVRTGLPAASVEHTGPLRLAIQRPGLLDSLGWQKTNVAMPGANEVGIDVKAAGLNFRDVMWSMGLLPDEALLDGFAGPTLGLECAGIVTAVGDGVTAFAPGDRVMAFAPASLSTRTVTAAHAVMRMPAGLDFAAAATVPVAFLTVAYSLGHLARIGVGETVLVHGGAGGVGLAAIQYALHRGARVFATAGSPAKRALLRNLGVEAVLDSRSLSFADDVLRLTAGEGVDAVLNSLSGEAMRRSLSLVKPFGRFLELGKRDFYENNSIGLRPFRHNVSYFGIDADQLPLKQPKLAAQLFDEIATLFAEGALRPLPHRTFDYADAEGAFRLMQSAGHIGKIVLAPGSVLPRSATDPSPFVAGTGVYVVTGGLDGFGRESARWLARNGARKLALLSRRGPTVAGADALIAEFAEAGVEAKAYAVDVSDRAALAAALDAIRGDAGTISGVIHAAVAMDDALLGSLDADRFARALAPKLAGAEALDALTRQDPIDLFLLFSSVTTSLGNPGQGNYVAANAAIEALAERRHAEGLPALAVQWGPIGDAGYLSRETQVSEMLTKQLGGAHLSAQDALDRIPALLASGAPVAGVATVRWGAMKNRLPLIASPLFSEMAMSAAEEGGEVDLTALLADLSPDEARERVTGLLIEEVARIMKLAPERVEAKRPLAELGMDSLMAVELRLAVEQRFGLSIPLLALSEGATLAAMAGRIIRGLGGEGDVAPADERSKLLERLALHEGVSGGIPAAEAVPRTEPGMAAVAARVP